MVAIEGLITMLDIYIDQVFQGYIDYYNVLWFEGGKAITFKTYLENFKQESGLQVYQFNSNFQKEYL